MPTDLGDAAPDAYTLPLDEPPAGAELPTVARTVASAAQQPSTEPGPAEIAVQYGLATPDGSGGVVFAPPPHAPPASGSVPVQRAEATPPPTTEPSAAAPPSAAPPAMPVTVAAPVTPPDPARQADELYERVERRLRTELLLERERWGALIDL